MPNETLVAPAPVTPSVPPPAPQGGVAVPPVPALKYAGFWLRAAALLVDGIIVGVVSAVLGLILGDGAFSTIIRLALSYAYYILMIVRYQATLGKMAVGLRVERTDGSRVTLGRAAAREVSKLLSAITLCVGYLMVAWTQKKQGLHDKIADTIVVENDPNKSKTGWVVLGVIAMLIMLAIPVIAIFSAITLASLNVAREKGHDALVRSELSTLSAQTELYFDARGNSYMGYCASSDAVTALEGASSAGTVDKNTTSYVCNDSANAYAASAPLQTGGYSCVDSTGADVEVVMTRPLAAGQTSCGSSAQ